MTVILKKGLHPQPKVNKIHEYLITTPLNILCSNLFYKLVMYVVKSYIRPVPPKYIIVGGSLALSSAINSSVFEKSKILNSHALDYNNFFETVPSVKIESYAIFLDEYAPYHPDYLMLNMKPVVKAEEYYPYLRNYFDYFEREHGIPVKIAAHPRANYQDKPGVFGDREIIAGQTQDLVKSAQLVLLHSSTSINYAVLYSKPMVFLECNKYLRNRLYYAPRYMAEILNSQSVVTIDDDSTFNISGNIFSYDVKAYKRYKENYIKMDGTPEDNTWDLFSKVLHGIVS